MKPEEKRNLQTAAAIAAIALVATNNNQSTADSQSQVTKGRQNTIGQQLHQPQQNSHTLQSSQLTQSQSQQQNKALPEMDDLNETSMPSSFDIVSVQQVPVSPKRNTSMNNRPSVTSEPKKILKSNAAVPNNGGKLTSSMKQTQKYTYTDGSQKEVASNIDQLKTVRKERKKQGPASSAVSLIPPTRRIDLKNKPQSQLDLKPRSQQQQQLQQSQSKQQSTGKTLNSRVEKYSRSLSSNSECQADKFLFEDQHTASGTGVVKPEIGGSKDTNDVAQDSANLLSKKSIVSQMNSVQSHRQSASSNKEDLIRLQQLQSQSQVNYQKKQMQSQRPDSFLAGFLSKSAIQLDDANEVISPDKIKQNIAKRLNLEYYCTPTQQTIQERDFFGIDANKPNATQMKKFIQTTQRNKKLSNKNKLPDKISHQQKRYSQQNLLKSSIDQVYSSGNGQPGQLQKKSSAAGSSTVRVSSFQVSGVDGQSAGEGGDGTSTNQENSENSVIFSQKYQSKNSIKLILSRSNKRLNELLNKQDSKNTPIKTIPFILDELEAQQNGSTSMVEDSGKDDNKIQVAQEALIRSHKRSFGNKTIKSVRNSNSPSVGNTQEANTPQIQSSIVTDVGNSNNPSTEPASVSRRIDIVTHAKTPSHMNSVPISSPNSSFRPTQNLQSLNNQKDRQAYFTSCQTPKRAILAKTFVLSELKKSSIQKHNQQRNSNLQKKHQQIENKSQSSRISLQSTKPKKVVAGMQSNVTSSHVSSTTNAAASQKKHNKTASLSSANKTQAKGNKTFNSQQVAPKMNMTSSKNQQKSKHAQTTSGTMVAAAGLSIQSPSHHQTQGTSNIFQMGLSKKAGSNLLQKTLSKTQIAAQQKKTSKDTASALTTVGQSQSFSQAVGKVVQPNLTLQEEKKNVRNSTLQQQSPQAQMAKYQLIHHTHRPSYDYYQNKQQQSTFSPEITAQMKKHTSQVTFNLNQPAPGKKLKPSSPDQSPVSPQEDGYDSSNQNASDPNVAENMINPTEDTHIRYSEESKNLIEFPINSSGFNSRLSQLTEQTNAAAVASRITNHHQNSHSEIIDSVNPFGFSEDLAAATTIIELSQDEDQKELDLRQNHKQAQQQQMISNDGEQKYETEDDSEDDKHIQIQPEEQKQVIDLGDSIDSQTQVIVRNSSILETDFVQEEEKLEKENEQEEQKQLIVNVENYQPDELENSDIILDESNLGLEREIRALAQVSIKKKCQIQNLDSSTSLLTIQSSFISATQTKQINGSAVMQQAKKLQPMITSDKEEYDDSNGNLTENIDLIRSKTIDFQQHLETMVNNAPMKNHDSLDQAIINKRSCKTPSKPSEQLTSHSPESPKKTQAFSPMKQRVTLKQVLSDSYNHKRLSVNYEQHHRLGNRQKTSIFNTQMHDLNGETQNDHFNNEMFNTSISNYLQNKASAAYQLGEGLVKQITTARSTMNEDFTAQQQQRNSQGGLGETSQNRDMKVYYNQGPVTPKHVRDTTLNMEEWHVIGTENSLQESANAPDSEFQEHSVEHQRPEIVVVSEKNKNQDEILDKKDQVNSMAEMSLTKPPIAVYQQQEQLPSANVQNQDQQVNQDESTEDQLIGRFSNTVDFNTQSLLSMQQFVPLTRAQQNNRQTFGSKPLASKSDSQAPKTETQKQDQKTNPEQQQLEGVVDLPASGKVAQQRNSLNSLYQHRNLLDNNKEDQIPRAGNMTERRSNENPFEEQKSIESETKEDQTQNTPPSLFNSAIDRLFGKHSIFSALDDKEQPVPERRKHSKSQAVVVEQKQGVKSEFLLPRQLLQGSNPLYRKYTLVLDLDETLVHFDNRKMVYKVRPFCIRFLADMAKLYEVVIFTAAHQSYANFILDKLDPDNTMIQHRLYRQHTIQVNNAFIKDLAKLGRPIERTLIIDNLRSNFMRQKENGIECGTWKGNINCRQLQRLANFLTEMAQDNPDDIRQHIAHFKSTFNPRLF